jgi:hypothetical protein
MKTHYTPGPWHTQGCTIYAGKNRVAQTWDTWYDGLPTPTMEADAGLIAAAPEMLAALEMALESLDAVDVPQEWDCRSKVRAAIAKAKGGAR